MEKIYLLKKVFSVFLRVSVVVLLLKAQSQTGMWLCW